jgi:sugar O-acyltransferase (sialic acid O-acetyltransferase NeuD family)
MSVSRRPLVIFGSGDLAVLAHCFFQAGGDYEVVAFSVDRDRLDTPEFLGLPLVAFDELEARFPPRDHWLFVAIGYSKLNRFRAERCQSARTMGYRLASCVGSRSITWPDLVLGDNCLVMDGALIQPGSRLGNGVIVWSSAFIGHHTVIGDDCFISANAALAGRVRLGARCFVGINATLRENISLGDHCIVGAACLILADAPAESVYIEAPTARAAMSSARLQGML